MKYRNLQLIQRVFCLGSNMWRYPQVGANNLPLFSILPQQQLTLVRPPQVLPSTFSVTQNTQQYNFQPNFEPQGNTNPLRPPLEDTLVPVTYPFEFTYGEKAVKFYEHFQRSFTGRKTPEISGPSEIITTNQTVGNLESLGTTSQGLNKTKDQEVKFPAIDLTISEEIISIDGMSSNVAMHRATKRNRVDSDGPSSSIQHCVKTSDYATTSKKSSPDFDHSDVLRNSEEGDVRMATNSPLHVMRHHSGHTEKTVGRPPKRKMFVTSYGREQRKYKAHSRHSSVKFSVTTYNVLAQTLLHDNQYLYQQCEDDHLQWESRSKLILQQILQNHPDVLCLQEVEESHYENFFVPELSKEGYEGVYKKRTGNKPDGCAIFYNSSLFSLDTSSKVEYYKRGVPYLDRDNVGLILLLALKKSPRTKVCVATTHLLFNPRRGDVKLAQMQVLFAEIDKLASKRQSAKPWKSSYYPVIFCGDLNLEPYCDLYDFVITGSLTYQGLLCRNMSGQEEGRGGNNKLMSHYILPEELGISDQCQYEDTFKDRLSAHKESKSKNKSGPGEIVQSSESTDVIVIEDGEIIDDEVQGCSATQSSSAKTHPMSDEDCMIVDSPNSRDMVDKSDSMSTLNDSMTSDANTSKSPESYSQLRDMTRRNTEKLSAFAAKVQPDDKLQQAVQKHCSHNKGTLSHQLNFVSVYSHEVVNKDNTLSSEVTTSHGRTNCTVDYIFYTVDDKDVHFQKNGAICTKNVKEGKLKLLEKLELYVDQELTEIGGLPNQFEGSDHTMLLAKFQLKYK